ncbi:hypothetical protein [Streptomyces sp. NPDC021608]|uniref:hypothetical protein n=1 Tax=Streptomyces sp. NPDC021608 TaxID=3154903 RepID=UPI003411C5FA
MSENAEPPTTAAPPTAAAAPPGPRGWSCCLLPPVLALGWFLGARFLPERVAWFPFWLAAVLWSGPDGHGGIGRLLG